MEIYTIGFTKKSAGEFFDILKRAGIRRLIDVRRNNTSQLAAFTKRDDLQFFLGEYRTDCRTLTPDASEFHTVAFAKLQLTNCSASH